MIRFRSLLIKSFLSFFTLGLPNIIVNVYPDNSYHIIEICDNAIDDDNDGLTDINDQDCICEIIQPKSLIPNPSFEEKNCCPSREAQLNCAIGWIQASEPTTDYFNTCGLMHFVEFPVPRPLPDGNGYVGFTNGKGRVGLDGKNPNAGFKEYAGACLLGPLKANKSYLLEFYIGFISELDSPPINITIFGTTDCKHLPFGVRNVKLGCPTNGPNWVKLGSKLVGGKGPSSWVQTSIQVRPDQNINAIALGPDCPELLLPRPPYYYLDNLVLAELDSFKFQITEASHPCSANFLLEVPLIPKLSYQWYKDDIALIGETGAKLKKIHGDGNYRVRTLNESGSCQMTKIYNHLKPVIKKSIRETICKAGSYNFGDKLLTKSGNYLHTFKTNDNCDSIVSLNLSVVDVLQDTLSVKIFEGDSFTLGKNKYKNKGTHSAYLHSVAGCDSVILLKLDFYKIYSPNIFSPNGDDVNDIFAIFGEEGLFEYAELTIYDRRGIQLFKGTSWDGKFNGKDLIPDVYTYTASIKLKNGHQKLIAGSVTLIR